MNRNTKFFINIFRNSFRCFDTFYLFLYTNKKENKDQEGDFKTIYKNVKVPKIVNVS